MSDAPTSDLGSMLRDVTASTKRLSSHSKAAGPRNQRLCLVPHTCRFLGQQSLGIELAVKCSSVQVFTSSPPFRSVKGDDQSAKPKLWTCDGFFAASLRYRAFAVEKKGPNTPSNVSRPRWRAFIFCRCRWGRGRQRHVALTKPPVDAHNVTQNRKICGCPRFALFRMTGL
jgi:hypothetical protein